MSEPLTIGPLSVRTRIQESHLRKLCKRRLIPFTLVGRYHVFEVGDIPAITEAARKAGYLREPEAAGCRS